MSEQEEAPLEHLNISELLQILLGPERGGHRLRRSVPAERLIHLIRTGETPTPDEISAVTDTRKRLQMWVNDNWIRVGSQLPCSGETRGQCTIHECTDGRHLDCYHGAVEHMI